MTTKERVFVEESGFFFTKQEAEKALVRKFTYDSLHEVRP